MVFLCLLCLDVLFCVLVLVTQWVLVLRCLLRGFPGRPVLIPCTRRCTDWHSRIMVTTRRTNDIRFSRLGAICDGLTGGLLGSGSGLVMNIVS